MNGKGRNHQNYVTRVKRTQTEKVKYTKKKKLLYNQEKHQELFNQYWKLGNWELQSSYLNSTFVLEQTHKKIANA
ncbi:hypothetical protein PR048_032840, partial [Dryococelus australis]